MRTFIIEILVLIVLVGCTDSRTGQTDSPTARSQTAAPATLSPADDGRQIFQANCAACHGKQADGNTPAGRTWHVPDLRSPQVQSLGDQQLLEIIRNGQGKMPAWGGLLSPIDLAHVLAYVRTIKAGR